jgi:hypothetical protein
MDAAEEKVRGGVGGIALKDALGADGGATGVPLKHEGAGEAELGLQMLGFVGQNLGEDFLGFVEQELIEARVAIEQEQGRIVRRMAQGFAESLQT